MKKSQVTARQVAELAGVSQTTVSFVLNQIESANISEATRERVLKAAQELGYVPAAAARSLARGRSNNIGLVLIKPHHKIFADPFVPNVITGLNQVTQEQGFRLLVEIVDGLDRLNIFENLLRSGEVAGALVNGVWWGQEEFLLPLIHTGYPIISIDQLDSAYTSIPMVTIDHFEGVRQMVSHLIGLHHHRIACITYAPSHDLHMIRRLETYRDSLETAGIPYDENLVRYGTYDPESGYEAMQSLLAEKAPPTAVFGMNDLMALGAMAAIREAGLRIPEDIAVVGYDDMRFSRFTSPPLTTMRAPEIALGVEAGRMLLDLIHQREMTAKQIYLRSELVIRESCGARQSSPDV
jgi:DNA-binding LacI/PurR family transcriptional regulator